MLTRAGEVAAAAGWRRVLVVTDPGLARLPLLARLQDRLHVAGIETNLFAGVAADPSIATVDAALAEAATPEAVVSLGGGSSIDTAKAIAACLAEGRGPASLAEAPPKHALPCRPRRARGPRPRTARS
jgi:alcohol dehydrogenase class IV